MLGDRLDITLARGRAAAERRMRSRAAVMRDMGMQPDPVTGMEVPTWAAVHADVPLRLGGANAGSSGTRTVTVGGTETQVAVRTAHMPVGTAGILDGDLIDVWSGEHAGTVLRVVEATGADQQTALRLPVFETTRPEEWS